MLSMTGYGKGVAQRDGLQLTVEMKSVNHKYLDLSFKTPKFLNGCDDIIRRIIRQRFARGHFDLFFSFENDSSAMYSVNVNKELAQQYYNAAKELSQLFEIENDITASTLMRFGDVLESKEVETDDTLISVLLEEALNAACDKMYDAKEREGNRIKEDLIKKSKTIEKLVGNIAQLAPKVSENYKIKLKDRITQYLDQVECDQAKLLNEVAFFADKSCIDEELVRLKSHIKRFEELLTADGSQGKQIDFLVQEMNREANTIGSKSNDLEITAFDLQLKNEIEKIREQVQNLE